MAHPATSPAEQSLYQQIGGEVTLSAVIRGFYRRVLDDNRVGPRFAHTDMGEMVQHQARAFGILTGGPNPKRMTVPQIHEWVREAHSGFGITNDEFNIVAGHLVAELESVGAPQFIPPLAAAFESFRGDVVTVEVPIPAGVG